jgi:hypothetical protein
MTAEAEISTPVETVTEETSTIVEPVEETETPAVEPDVTEEAAEVQAEVAEEAEPQTVYAGKYNSIEALEKGYKELESKLGQPNEYETKYKELLEKQQKAEREAQEARIKEANNHGFRTVEDQEAHEKLQATELEWYANYLNLVAPENYENARAYLGEYLRTGQVAYFNEAKKLFPLDFVENVANAKTQLSARLQGEIAQKRQLERDEFDKNLANQIKGQFNEFLADSATNQAKANALKAMCDAGAINSVEDMQNFVNLYTSIVDSAKELAIKEHEAAKVIEETKQKAVIDGGAVTTSNPDGLKDSYTEAEVYKMAPEEFDRLYTKYGDKFTSRIK